MTSPLTVQSSSVLPQLEILIACDDDAVAQQLQTVFRGANLASVCTKSIATACYYARSGRFPVIFSAPSLHDGSWRQLLDASRHLRLAPAVVVVARSFDINEWGDSLTYGAYDVLDSLMEIPRAPEVAVQAFSAPSQPCVPFSGLDSGAPEAA